MLQASALAVLRVAYRLCRGVTRTIPALDKMRPKSKRKFLRATFGRVFPMLAGEAGVFHVQGLRLQVPSELMAPFMLQDYEPEIRRYMNDHLAPGMVVADVGANIGFHALLMAQRVGTSGRVVAIEPGPDNIRYLKKNKALNEFDQIEVIAAAAGAQRENASLFVGALGTTHSLSQPGPSGESVAVEVIPLDALISGPLDFAKIDAEGHELEVLGGMTRILSENTCLRLIVEWSPSQLAASGHEVDSLPSLLRNMDFELSVLGDRFDREVDELLDQALDDSSGKPRRVDLIAERGMTI